MSSSVDRRILALLPEPCFVVREDGEIVVINQAAADLFGQPVSDFPGKKLGEFLYGTTTSLADYLARCSRNGQMVYGSLRVTGKPEQSYRAEGAAVTPPSTAAPAQILLRLKAGESASSKFLTLNREIDRLSSEIRRRMRAEQDLKIALEEKNTLLREMHHRVKNNMQVIVSLLNFQSRREHLPEVKNAFQNIVERIRAMALIHEQLYSTSLVSKIAFSTYIESLVRQLITAHFPEDRIIQLELDLRPVDLDIDKALPLGLITNELMINCLKHAFTEFENARITVRLYKIEGDYLRLEVVDNGAPLTDTDVVKSGSLGFKLINMLTSQLQGRFEMRAETEGKTFTAEIPLDPPA